MKHWIAILLVAAIGAWAQPKPAAKKAKAAITEEFRAQASAALEAVDEYNAVLRSVGPVFDPAAAKAGARARALSRIATNRTEADFSDEMIALVEQLGTCRFQA